jgi:hypothetical protein
VKNRLIRLGLVGALAVVASAPMTAPAQAWSCVDPVFKLLCVVEGTACNVIDLATGRGELCQLG